MLAKKTSKNQLTLPKEIIKEFPEVQYFDVTIRDNAIVLNPVTVVRAAPELRTIRQKMKALGVPEQDIEGAVTWARERQNRRG